MTKTILEICGMGFLFNKAKLLLKLLSELVEYKLSA